MGWFSTPKCPIHRTEYSIGTDGLTNHYYCKQCYSKARKDKKESDELKNRISQLEKMLLNKK